MYRAFHLWSANSQLVFRETRRGDQRADIVVSFGSRYHGDAYPFDGPGYVLAHAFYPAQGGDLHFDSDEKWSVDAANDGEVEVFSVSVHEIGHSLGLSHSEDPTSLMFPYYQDFTVYQALPRDDQLAIHTLYGKPMSGRPTMRPPRQPWTQPTTPRPTTPSYYPTRMAARPTRPPTRPPTPTTPPHNPRPDECDAQVDALAVIRQEIYVFSGHYFWRMKNPNEVKSAYPALITVFWNGFPTDTTIDAIFEMPEVGSIFIFSGNRYWVYESNLMKAGFPRPLTDLGLPDTLTHLDAAMVWAYNQKVYFFSGKAYWRLDERSNKVELDYPRDMANVWRGVPYNLSGAMTDQQGVTHFFKDQRYWRFDDDLMEVSAVTGESGSSTGAHWLGCSENKASSFSTSSQQVNSTPPLTPVNSIFISLTLMYLLKSCRFIT